MHERPDVIEVEVCDEHSVDALCIVSHLVEFIPGSSTAFGVPASTGVVSPVSTGWASIHAPHRAVSNAVATYYRIATLTRRSE